MILLIRDSSGMDCQKTRPMKTIAVFVAFFFTLLLLNLITHKYAQKMEISIHTRVQKIEIQKETQKIETPINQTNKKFQDYTKYYRSVEVPVNGSAMGACSANDKPLPDSQQQPSAGCRRKDTPEGIELRCAMPIDINCDLPTPKARHLFYQHLKRTPASCENIRDVGDASKDGVWKICMSKPYNLQVNSCLVYSFGIHDEWSFDDTISNTYGCEVHSFDPTMVKGDHKRDKRITFHNMGISGHGLIFQNAKENGWRLKSLKDIITYLGHENRVIDILKIDVEFAEWDAFEDALAAGVLKNVRQIATEFHVWTDHTFAYVRFIRLLTALENAGFEKWYSNDKIVTYRTVNPETGKTEYVVFQLDTGYINTKFLDIIT